MPPRTLPAYSLYFDGHKTVTRYTDMYVEKSTIVLRHLANWLTGGAFRRIERRLAKLEALVAQNNDGQTAMHSAIFDARQEATVREFRQARQRQT